MLTCSVALRVLVLVAAACSASSSGCTTNADCKMKDEDGVTRTGVCAECTPTDWPPPCIKFRPSCKMNPPSLPGLSKCPGGQRCAYQHLHNQSILSRCIDSQCSRNSDCTKESSGRCVDFSEDFRCGEGYFCSYDSDVCSPATSTSAGRPCPDPRQWCVYDKETSNPVCRDMPPPPLTLPPPACYHGGTNFSNCCFYDKCS